MKLEDVLWVHPISRQTINFQQEHNEGQSKVVIK